MIVTNNGIEIWMTKRINVIEFNDRLDKFPAFKNDKIFRLAIKDLETQEVSYADISKEAGEMLEQFFDEIVYEVKGINE